MQRSVSDPRNNQMTPHDQLHSAAPRQCNGQILVAWVTEFRMPRLPRSHYRAWRSLRVGPERYRNRCFEPAAGSRGAVAIDTYGVTSNVSAYPTTEIEHAAFLRCPWW